MVTLSKNSRKCQKQREGEKHDELNGPISLSSHPVRFESLRKIKTVLSGFRGNFPPTPDRRYMGIFLNPSHILLKEIMKYR